MNVRDQEKTLNETECKNCKNHFQGSYCNKCGQKTIQERFTLKHLINLVFDSFNVEKGLFYTVKLLFTKPGKLINDYVEGRTKDFYNPLKYLILIASINAILMLWFNIFETNIANTNEFLGEDREGTKLQLIITEYIKTYLNIFTILVLPFYSLISKWIFKKYNLYYAEHLIINGYLFAQYTLLQMITYLVFSVIPGLSKFSLPFAVVVFISYYTYALRGVFKIKFFKSFLSSTTIYVFGFLFFIIFLLVISTIIILILKLSGFNLKELVQ